MNPQTIADGTAAIISLIVLATLAALWLVSWAFHRLQDKLSTQPESHADRWKRIQSEVTARMQEHARQFEERLETVAQDPPQTLAEYLATHHCKGFKPSAHYNSDGDMIKCWIADDPCYGKQITPGITVMRSFDTDEIVGVQIHGVQRMIELEAQLSELETLFADSRQREASGERWEEYTGDGR